MHSGPWQGSDSPEIRGIPWPAFGRRAGPRRLSGHAAPHLAGDVSRAISELEAAADRSRDAATARALSVLTRDLRTVLGELRTSAVVPGTAMQALNRDAARTDAACGTRHV